PLMTGGTLLVPPPDVFAAPDRLLWFLRAARPTILHCTPGLLEVVLAALAGVPGKPLDSLRLVVSAGAQLRWGLVRGLLRATDATVVNAYGATETPQIASCEVVTPELVADTAHLPDERAVGVGFGVDGAELLLSTMDGEVGDARRGEVLVR